jgi:cyclophilin family peptidyl-prolyl cis-trans isomerase
MKNHSAWIAPLIPGILSLAFLVGSARADTVVKFTINGYINGLYGQLGSYQIQLLDSQFNDINNSTVTNFLQYVNNGNYNGTFIHRSAKLQDGSPFVIQGGGFTAQTGTSGEILALNPIVNYGEIQNEFSPTRSNVRGTVAMARVGGLPNSATNQWFINLNDQNTFLDTVDGGFTVFGRVIGEGMTLVDAISDVQDYNLTRFGSAFNEVPLYQPYLYSELLVTFTNVAVVPTIEWKGGSTTNWGTAANWTPSTSAPGGVGVNLVVGSQNAANNIIDMVSAGRTVGNLYYNSNVSTTIQSAGHYSLTVDNGASASIINVLGNHAITAPVVLNSNTVFSGDGTLTLAGGISGAGDMNIFEGDIVASKIQVGKLIIGAGSKVTIQPLPGGPMGGAINAVPEPSVFTLLGLAALGFLTFALKRR